MEYSILKSASKGLKAGILIGLGLVITGLQISRPDIFNLTIGALLITIYDGLKHGEIGRASCRERV